MSKNAFVDTDEFLRGYLECALWSSNDPDTEDPLDDKYSVECIGEDWTMDAQEDCNVFCRNHGYLIRQLGELTGRTDDALGHDFWLTRNGHGAGYWDRYMDALPVNRDRAETVGREITELCKPYGECNLFPDDMKDGC